MKRFIILILFTATFSFLNAQSDNTSLLDTNVLLNVTTGEIFVTSTRIENMIKDIPLPMEVTSGEDILKSSVTTLPEVLSMNSGISLSRDGIWAADVNIRGLSKYNVVTLIDGTRIETATDLAARLSMIDLSDIERVEIIKSGASSLYGTGATGGVVSIFTKSGIYNPTKFLNVSFVSGYNTVNKNPFAKLGLNLGGKKWYLKFSGTIRKAENTNTPKGEIPNSQYRDNYLTAGLGIRPINNHELLINYQRFDAYDVGFPGGYPLFPQGAKVTYPRELRELYSVEYKITDLIKPLKLINVKYYYSYILRDVDNITNQVTIKPATTTTPKQRISVLDISPVGQHYVNGIQLQTEWKITDNNFLVAGVDLWQRQFDSRREKTQKIETYDSLGINVSNTVIKITGEKPVPESNYKSYGIYAQDNMHLVKGKLKVNIGGRFDLIKITNSIAYQPVYEITNGVYNPNPSGQKVLWNATDVTNNSWSANAGALYSLMKDLDITFNISRSFRSPSLEERYQYIDLGSYLRVGNPDLNPEQGYLFDFGVRIWKEHISFNGNIFYNTFSDLVIEQPGSYQGKSAYIKANVGKALLYGFDFDVMYSFHKEFIAYFSAAYVRGEDTDNDLNLPQIPPLNGRIGIKTGLFDKVIADVSTVIFAEQNKTASGEFSTPGYVTFDFSINTTQLETQYGTIQVFAGIQNIFDKDYRNHLATNRGTVTIEPGRNFYLKISLGF